MSVQSQIENKLALLKGGKILFPADFRGLGADTAIKMSLSRLCGNGLLIRLSHGIYMKPQKSAPNQVFPTPLQLATAIAARENIKIKPSGAFAQYVLGLIPTEPDELTFITDGEPRQLSIGSRSVIFKPTTPKKLSLKGKWSSLVIQVMEDVGKDTMTDDLMKQLYNLLIKEQSNVLAEDAAKAPAWIYKLINHLQKEKINNHETTN